MNIHYNHLVFLLISICSYQLYAQDNNPFLKQIDSLSHVVEESVNDSVTIKALIELDNIFFLTNDNQDLQLNLQIVDICNNNLNDSILLNNNKWFLIKLSASYNNIAIHYENHDDFKEALNYYLNSLEIEEEIGNNNSISITCNNISNIYIKQENYKEAIIYHEKSLMIEERMRMELKKKFALQQQADSINLEKSIIIQHVQQEQLKDERSIRVLLIIGLVIIIIFLVFVFNQLKTTRTQKTTIEEQHNLLNRTHKEITDSINYAKNIQDALMTSTVYMKDVIPESFIFFQPKDVVSGDFYWVYRNRKDHIYFTVADCTGHGIPGAFMSMIGTSLLNENIIENGIEDTSIIMNNMRDSIIKSLNQKEKNIENRDGMDMALCKLDPVNLTLQYSGAYNPLIHIRNGDINQINADSQPVALNLGKKTPFLKHDLQLKKGDLLYIYSDGFADQFGGEKDKKYMNKKFKKFLLEISDLPMEQQEYLLKIEFIDWMGKNEQIDDVCVMGIKI